jgi:hypothetical protein
MKITPWQLKSLIESVLYEQAYEGQVTLTDAVGLIPIFIEQASDKPNPNILNGLKDVFPIPQGTNPMVDAAQAYITGSFKMADIGYVRPENLPFFLYGHVTPITKLINGLIDAAIMIQEYEFVRRVQMIKDIPKNLKEDLTQFKNDIIKAMKEFKDSALKATKTAASVAVFIDQIDNMIIDYITEYIEDNQDEIISGLESSYEKVKDIGVDSAKMGGSPAAMAISLIKNAFF